MTLLLSLTCVSLSQQVSLAWCYGACCPLFPVLSTPSWSRQMSALPGSGSDGGFFLFSLYSRLVHAQDRGLDRRQVSMQSAGFLSEATFSNLIAIM